jgi:hypothetical protein
MTRPCFINELVLALAEGAACLPLRLRGAPTQLPRSNEDFVLS